MCVDERDSEFPVKLKSRFILNLRDYKGNAGDIWD